MSGLSSVQCSASFQGNGMRIAQNCPGYLGVRTLRAHATKIGFSKNNRNPVLIYYAL